MFSLREIVKRVKSKAASNQLLYIVSVMLFFWCIFEGIISYATPILITERGFTPFVMGIILASSSVVGALFDFVTGKFIKNPHFRRVYFIMFIICFVTPFLIWKATTVVIYILAMGAWGIINDLRNFGTFDFVSREAIKEDHAASFGIIDLFRTLGYFIAPLIAGIVITHEVNFKAYGMSLGFLGASFILFVALLSLSKRNSQMKTERPPKSHTFKQEVQIWKKIGTKLLPVLAFIILINIFDAFFWTIGPLFTESYKNYSNFGGLFLSAYLLPSILTGWFVGRITKKFGQKRTAYIAFIMSAVLMGLIGFMKSPIVLLATVFLSSMINSIAWPAIKGAYADYICEAQAVETEIEGLGDFALNIGYVLGPILAGLLAGLFGNSYSFSILGGFSVLVTVILLIATPKKISVKMGKI